MAPPGSTDPSLGYPTRKWVVESPSPNWSHHRRHTACWDEARHRRTTELVTNLRSPLTFLGGGNSSKRPAENTSFAGEGGGPRRAAKMMEEIDRFQVPSAVQEAEMQAEMQPLVSHRWDNHSVFWLCFLIRSDGVFFRLFCSMRPAVR